MPVGGKRPGAGRKRNPEPMVRYTFRLPESRAPEFEALGGIGWLKPMIIKTMDKKKK